MSPKRAETPEQFGSWFSKKRVVIISVVLVFLISLGLLISYSFLQASEIRFSSDAAIIDQLAGGFPNLTFANDMTATLENYGFNVVYHNKSLNVDFFKRLAQSNYGIIILRAHSALREDNSTVDIFTSEEFSEYKYKWELENGLLTPGRFSWTPERYYFAITSRFIQDLEGKLPKSIVIAMGCWSLKPNLEQMAKAFIEKGAIAYVGWTNAVLSNDTDYETLRLVQNLLNENKSLAEAVLQASTYQYKTTEGIITSRMNFYPTSAGKLKVSELIAETRIVSARMVIKEHSICACFSSLRASDEVKRLVSFVASRSQ